MKCERTTNSEDMTTLKKIAKKIKKKKKRRRKKLGQREFQPVVSTISILFNRF